MIKGWKWKQYKVYKSGKKKNEKKKKSELNFKNKKFRLKDKIRNK